MDETILIYDSKDKVIFMRNDAVFLVKNGIHKLNVKEFIREIDTCPDKSSEWKRETILKTIATNVDLKTLDFKRGNNADEEETAECFD